MRLSDAIALGRTCVRPIPNEIFDGDGGGCAIGMALAANGVTERGLDDLRILWPWTAEYERIPRFTCGCANTAPTWCNSVGTAIAHIFDDHIFGHRDWTLDQLIDWVRSVEPAEEIEITDQAAEQQAVTVQP